MAMGGAEEGGAGSPPPRCSLARQCHLHADGEEEEGVRRPPTDGREEGSTNGGEEEGVTGEEEEEGAEENRS